MFEELLEQLEDALRDLERTRDGARQRGWPLEDIHLRMTHLKQAIKLAKASRDAFEKAISGDDDYKSEDSR